MTNVLVILPVQLTADSMRTGCIKELQLGHATKKIRIPPGVTSGQRLRLKGYARHVDPSLVDGDIHLLVVAGSTRVYEKRRDLEMEFPLDRRRMSEGGIERVTLGDIRLDVRIPSGLVPGMKLRIPGTAEYGNGGIQGDIYLRLVPDQRRVWYRRAVPHLEQHKYNIEISIPYFLPFLVKVSGEWIFRTSDAALRDAAF